MASETLYPTLGLLYLCLLVPICLLAWHKNSHKTPQEYYLAGRSLGPFVLILTLFATTYSSSTMMGYPAEAWKRGFGWVISLGIPVGAIICYHLVVPKLRPVAQSLHFITPGDWITHRFAGQPSYYPLKVVLSLIMMLVSANVLFAQFKAMGEITEALSGDYLSYHHGVLLMATIVLLYDLAGGMRAVAWTDALQGSIMMIGLVALLIWLGVRIGSLDLLAASVSKARPASLQPPDSALCLKWLSTMLLAGLSIIVYPHALQRYFAARSHHTAFLSMSLFGLLMILIHIAVIVIGLGSLAILGCSDIQPDQVLPLLLSDMGSDSYLFRIGAGMVFLSLCAAMMSTADSVLLTTVSIMRRDLLRKPATNSGIRLDSLLALATVVTLAGAAMHRDISLWHLVELKLEALLQCFPAFVLCLHYRSLSARAVLSGICSGLVIYVYLLAAGQRFPMNIHAGLWGLAANILCCLLLSMKWKPAKTVHNSA